MITVDGVPTDTITVRLLGGFAIEAGNRMLSSLPPQAVSLLSFLVVNRSRPQTRDLLAGRFWPELPEDRARKRLSNCLWQIKSGLTDAGLPGDLLVADSNTVRLAAEQRVEVDAEDFEARLADFERELKGRQVKGVLTDRLADVVSGYPGDFLSGYYHEWIEPERNRIRERYHSALVELIGLYKSRSQYDIALRFARVLVDEEPLREDLHREVMRLHALLDQAPAAERQFITCQRVLQNELGLEPSEETVALLERIRSDAPAPAGAYQVDDPDRLGLIGRRHEMSVLVGRADELLSGRGGVVLVEGEPGIGKTRLVREFMEAAEWRGARVLYAGHTELSRMQPYAALKEVLAPAITGLRGEHLVEVVEPVWLRKAAEVLPELHRLIEGSEPSQPLRPSEEPARMSEALARVVQAQGGLGPTVIVLEDVHWCDDDSMQVLVQLGSRLARSDVLLCLSYRRHEAEQSEAVWADLGKLEALAAASRLVVGPLTSSEVRDLLQAHLGPGGLPTSTVAQVAELTKGNPLYVLESVRDPTSLIVDGVDGEEGEVPLLPPAVARSLETRVSALAGPTRSVLEILASLAEAATPKLVAEVAGMERLATVEALAQTTNLGFVIDEADGRCRFSHDQTRRMVYQLMGSERRREVHGRIYEAQVAIQTSSAQLAHHARLAGQMTETHRWHLEAAKEALAINGYRTAADHYGQADDAAQELGVELVDRAGDLLAYEATLDVLGRRSDQTMLLKSLQELELPLPLTLTLAEREAWLLVNTDDPGEAARVAAAAVDEAKASGLPFVGLLNAIAVARYRAGDLEGAMVAADEALAEATTSADRIGAETIRGKALVDLLRHQEGKVHLARAAAEAEAIGDARAEIEAVNYLAVTEFAVGHYQLAEQTFLEALELSEAIGYRWGEGFNLVNLATLHAAQGHGGQALDLFNRANEILGSLDYRRVESIVKYNLADLSHRLLGDDEEAVDLARSAAVYFRSVGDEPLECLTMSILCSIDVRHGRRRLARRRLNDLLARTDAIGSGTGRVEVRRILATLEADGGDNWAAAAQLDEVLDLSEDYAIDNVLPNVLAHRAVLATAIGDLATAESHVDRALSLNKAGLDQAHVTAWRCATTLAVLDRGDEATEQFGLAHEMLAASLRGLSPAVADRSRQVIPEHAQIVEQYERRFTISASVALPAADAPLGRPLRNEELVDVTWTVSDPDDWTHESAGARRRHRLVRVVGEANDHGASPRITDLAEAMGVSERTVKRDLADLRTEGVQLRTRRST